MIILTGGSGTLGQELQKHIKCVAPSRKALDILDPRTGLIPIKTSLIVHAAAFTDLVRAEKEKELCYQTNVIGTRNLASLGIPMLYISTEYVFDGKKGNYVETDYPNPVNFYSLTKLLGEYESRKSPRSVVIRCLFKSRPFKHSNVCNDMFTSGDYVDRIASEIALAIKKFDELPSTIHIGTGRKNLYDLADETRRVNPITTKQVYGVRLPVDTSLCCKKWLRLKKENGYA